MATRSRLGRDPLQDAAKSKTPAAGRKPTKKKAAGAGQTPAPEALATPPQADDTRNLQTPETTAPVAEVAVAPGVEVAAAEVQDAAAGEPSPAAPETAAGHEAPSVLTVPSQPDALGAAFQPPTDPAIPGVGPSAAPYAAPSASPSLRATPPVHPAAANASCGPDSLLQGEHALTLFFRGVLDAFVPDDPGALHVVVDAAAGTVPVEKILYFSHALQRIVLPTARPDQFACRPGEDCGPLPVLTARLRKGGADRHVLELFDNGHFFRTRLPQVRLGLEALKPLVTFVLGRGGSVRLAQGRCVAFEITG